MFFSLFEVSFNCIGRMTKRNGSFVGLSSVKVFAFEIQNSIV